MKPTQGNSQWKINDISHQHVTRTQLLTSFCSLSELFSVLTFSKVIQHCKVAIVIADIWNGHGYSLHYNWNIFIQATETSLFIFRQESGGKLVVARL